MNRYYRRASHGTLTTDEARGMLRGFGLGGLGAADTSGAIVYETDPATGMRYAGVWVKKPAPCPSGYTKHSGISHQRNGWIFCVAGADDDRGPAEVSHDPLTLEQNVASGVQNRILMDQPALVSVAVAFDPAQGVSKAQYKDELRRTLDTLKLIEAAILVGNIAPSVPDKPLRPANLDVSGSQSIRDLEKKIDEFLLVRIPYARQNAGQGAPQQVHQAAALSPGAEPLVLYTGGSATFDETGGLYNQPAGIYIIPEGTPGIVDSSGMISAPQATSAAGSGTAGAPGFLSKVPTWAWAVGGAGVLGLAYLLTRRKKRR